MMTSSENELISSKKNPRIQRTRKLLASRQFREAERSFVLEGVRLVDEAVHSGWTITDSFYADTISERGKQLIEQIGTKNASCSKVSEAVMREITETDTPQGIVAILNMKEIPVPAGIHLILILDAIRDPGNVGTILRTALAAGVDLVLIGPETADPYSPKVLRAAMGAQLKLPMRDLDWQGIESLLQSVPGMKVLLADKEGGTELWDTDLVHPTALIVSNEANGASEPARRMASGIITIPMGSDSESLNAGIAASLLVYEALRQRRATRA